MPSSQTHLCGFAGINAIWCREYGKYRIGVGSCVHRLHRGIKKKKKKKRILFIAVHKDSSYFIHVASNACAECRRASNIELFVSLAR